MLGKEPTVVLGALSEVIRQIIPMLILFNAIQWSGEQVAQVMSVVSAAIAFFTILLTRSQTVTTQKANSQIQTALNMPNTASVSDVVNAEHAASNP